MPIQRCRSRHAPQDAAGIPEPPAPARQSRTPAPNPKANRHLAAHKRAPPFLRGGPLFLIRETRGPGGDDASNLHTKGKEQQGRGRLLVQSIGAWLWRGTKRTGASGHFPASRHVIGGVRSVPAVLLARHHFKLQLCRAETFRPTVARFTPLPAPVPGPVCGPGTVWSLQLHYCRWPLRCGARTPSGHHTSPCGATAGAFGQDTETGSRWGLAGAGAPAPVVRVE